MIFEKIRERLQEKKSEHLHDEKVMQELGKNNIANFCSAKARALDGAIDIVNQVEAEYNNGWIPCSERLPEEGQCVVVQTKDFFDYEDETPIQIRMFDTQHNGYNWKEIGASEWLSNSCIVAWQPLPEPYVAVAKNATTNKERIMQHFTKGE